MKILYFDIETSPIIAACWDRFPKNGVAAIIQNTELLSVAWMFEGDSNISGMNRMHFRDRTDKALVKAFCKVINEADVVVAHNGDEFDIKKVRGRVLANGLAPLRLFNTVDTKKLAKARFGLDSNSLDDLAKLLGLGRKKKNSGIEMWLACMRRSASAFKEMMEYNKHDVRLLQNVYKKLAPHSVRLPNLLKKQHEGCPKPHCGSLNVVKDGVRGNAAGKAQQMKCKDCKGYYLIPYKETKNAK